MVSAQRRRDRPRLFSYVVDQDLGFAPNPADGLCSLAKCKFGSGRRNIVELAEVGDWIVGTGGANLRKSAGHGKLIHAMKVERKMQLGDYCQTHRRRVDARHESDEAGRFALLSRSYYYFGRNAIDISGIPSTHLDHPFEKRGPGFRSDFSDEFVEAFGHWISKTFEVGVHGPPCQPYSDRMVAGAPARVRRRPGCR